MIQPNRTTILLDASALRESACMLRVVRKIVNGYTNAVNSADIEFGSAFHLYRKIAAEGKGNEITQLVALKEALEYYAKAPKYFKERKQFLTAAYLTTVCREYEAVYPFASDDFRPVVTDDGKSLVEIRIALPYYISPCGKVEVLLCGTIDEICMHRTLGFYCIKDYKTTSLWDKDKYFASYEMSTQLMFYKLLVGKFAKLYPDSIIGKIYAGGNILAFIDGVFLKSGDKVEFARSSPYPYKPKRMAEFETLVHSKVLELVDCVLGVKPLLREGLINGACEKVYGPCDFMQVCACEDDDMRQDILNNNFIVRSYNPMTHGELK